MTKVAEEGSSTPLESENSGLAQTSSKEPPQDTSLDDLKSMLVVEFGFKTDDIVFSKLANMINSWHKAEIAKLFEQIRSELGPDFFKTVTVKPHQNINEAWADMVLEALTRMEENE